MNIDKELEALRQNDEDIARKLRSMTVGLDIKRHALLYLDHITRLAQSTNKAQARAHLALAQEEHERIIELTDGL